MVSPPQGQEGVAAALAACKILREMSHQEKEAEVVRKMKEAKYEQLAVGKRIQCQPFKTCLSKQTKCTFTSPVLPSFHACKESLVHCGSFKGLVQMRPE